jgi:hypothetical protein
MTRTAAPRLPETLTSPARVASAVTAARIRRGYATNDWDALLAGEIVTADARDADRQHAQASGVIRCAPRDVWPTLVDFESRPAYLPGAQEIRILRVIGNQVWLAERLKILFVTIAYRVINTLDPDGGCVSWVLDETAKNDIAATTGSWQLVPLAGGRHTLVRYSNWLDTGQPVPRAVESFLLRRSLPQMISGLRAEVERRRQDRTGPGAN